MPATPQLAAERPTAIGTAILQSGAIGNYDTTGIDFYIKLTRFRARIRVPDAEDSGDGNLAPSFLPVLWTYIDIQLGGIMVAGQALGIVNLRNTAKNPTTAVIKLWAGGTRNIQTRVVIREMEIDFNYVGEFTGVGLTLRGTCSSTGANTLIEDAA